MSLFGKILDIFADTSKGKNKFHIFRGKSGNYIKWGSDKSGRKGKTISWWK